VNDPRGIDNDARRRRGAAADGVDPQSEERPLDTAVGPARRWSIARGRSLFTRRPSLIAGPTVTVQAVPKATSDPEESIARIQEVLDVLPGSVALLVPITAAAGQVADWQVAAISPDTVDIAGRRAAQMLGCRVLDLYPAVAGTELWKALARTYDAGCPTVVDLTYTEVATGIPRESRYTMRVRRHIPGVVVSWLRRDPEEQWAARLADTERMGNLGWGIWRADGSIEWSDQLYQIVNRDPVRGPMSVDEFMMSVHADDRARVQERFTALWDHDERFDIEFRLALASGVRHVRSHTELTRDGTGRPLETFGLLQDITDMHDSRERLLRTRDELAAKEQRLAEERRLAARLQRIILPVPDQPLNLPGMRVGVRHLPAEEASQVGGDWYHAMELPNGCLMLAIGDVAGHGLPAASVMAQLRHALTGLAAGGLSPAATLRALNTILCDHVPQPTLATVVIAHYQPDGRTLTWAQAGHPPCLLIRNARPHLLDRPEGLVLGALRDAGYATAQATLEPGDLLLMYTDGLVERPDRSMADAITDLAATMVNAATAAGADADRPSSLLRAVNRANSDDDASLLVAEACT
jgi:serine phosphatase RsbU (regulator of sigma subunit)